MEQREKVMIMKRLREIRTKLLFSHPFWGTLLLHLQLGLVNCQTAYTDMENIVFDPEFVSRLDDSQVEVIMMHEVMHCALAHCLRAWNCQRYLYNVACDIVVNSMLLWTMGYEEFEIDGENLMHLAPNLQEGRFYTAEEVYDMLLQGYETDDSGENKNRSKGQGSGEEDRQEPTFIDRHDQWNHIDPNGSKEYEWQRNLQEAKKYMAGDQICQQVRDIFDNYEDSKIDWKEQLHNFMHQVMNRTDYTFIPNDRRYSYTDFIVPAFKFEEEYTIQNLWFCVDTSGSITKRELTVLFGEIEQALIQFDGFRGKLSFFDYDITEPVEFQSAEDLRKYKPRGGGGTSFYSIFRYMKKNMMNELPEAVIIMTDGCASFPAESDTLGVPVLWIMINNREEQPPWGKVIHITAKDIWTQ